MEVLKKLGRIAAVVLAVIISLFGVAALLQTMKTNLGLSLDFGERMLVLLVTVALFTITSVIVNKRVKNLKCGAISSTIIGYLIVAVAVNNYHSEALFDIGLLIFNIGMICVDALIIRWMSK